jgi:hypothetical protein
MLKMKKLNLFSTYFTLFFVFFLINSVQAQEFLKVQGKKIVKGDQEILLRGMGLGGWMLQEGYMLHTAGFAPTQHQIKAKIAALIGEDNTETFYESWRANHVRKIDVDSLAAWGFNSIRLPLHYNLFTLPIEEEPVPGENTWLETGFRLTDSLLAWCEVNQIYLILDLHAAPGGQGNELSICDGDASKPNLWESQANRDKTVALWRKLAEHYVNKPWIGGYDLINETNYNLPGGTALRNLYQRLTDTIRAVDTNHIIFIEGNWFANDFTGLTPPWDNNMVYSFHKYWNYNNVSDIQWMLNMRNTYNIPIWLGESGENSNVWFTDCIKLLEGQNIGWAWWPMKKIGSIAGPLSSPLTNDYQVLLNYWSGQGGQPTAEFALNTLTQVAENQKLENCEFHKDVIDAMFRQVYTTEAKPFSQHTAPGAIFAPNFDLGSCNDAYFDNDTADYHSNTSIYTSWNSGDNYRNDGVDIEKCQDVQNSNGFDVGWTQDGEWLQYTLDVAATAVYDLQVRVACPNTGFGFHFQLDEVDVSPKMTFSSTGGYQSWQTVTISDIILEQGNHRLRFVVDVGGFNFNRITSIQKGEPTTIPARFISAATAGDAGTMQVVLNKPMNPILPAAPAGFKVLINNVEAAVTNVQIDQVNPKLITLTVGQQFKYSDVIKVSYDGTGIHALDGTLLEVFFSKPVTNNLPKRKLIPGLIQAEDFSSSFGIQTETTTDAGGGLNVGFFDAGDYLDYLVDVTETGAFTVKYRVASLQQAGKIELQIVGETNVILHELILPITGGWQIWTTITKDVTLSKGEYIFRILIKTAGFNLNWFEFVSHVGIDDDADVDFPGFNIFPNPNNGRFSIQLPGNENSVHQVQIVNSLGQIVFENIGTSLKYFPLVVDLSDHRNGIYFLIVRDGNEIRTSKFIIQNN